MTTSERQLSSSEHAVWLLDQAAPLNGVLVAHVTHRGALDAGALGAALARLQRRHPLLRARIAPGAKGPRFVDEGRAAPPIPLRITPRTDGDAWRAVMEDELNRAFPAEVAPLMRAVLVAGDTASEIVLAHHHVISDALSAVYQARDLLAALADPSLPEEPGYPLRPAMEALLPPSLRGWSRAGALSGFVWRQAAARMGRRPRRLAFDERPPPSARRTRILHRTLDASATAALIARCRAERTTVQGALGAALLLALAEDLGLPATVGIFSAISLRHLLDPPVGEEVGLYVSQGTTFHDVAPTKDPFVLARDVRAALTRNIEQREPFVTFPLLGLFIPSGTKDVVARFARRVDQAGPMAAGVTNLGPLPIADRYGPDLALTGIHFAIGLALVVPVVLACATFRGALTWNLLHVDPLVGAARAERMAARVEAALTVR